MNKKAFTLIELLAVIVILAIVLAIAIPGISGLIRSSTRGAFESDAKLLVKAINYKLLEDVDFDVTNIKKNPDTGEDTVASILKLSTNNYQEVSAYRDEFDKVNILVIGQNKWADLVAYGTLLNITIEDSSNFEGGYICAGTIGDALPNNVLIGKSFTNDNGYQTGMMANRTGGVSAQTANIDGTTLKLQPQEGYYDGSINNTINYTDTDFIASNIKEGISIFGLQGTLISGQPHGEQQYNSLGTFTFTVPANVMQVFVTMVGGGGGGGGSHSSNSYCGAGGGGGGSNISSLTVTPGSSMQVVVGGGGSGSGPAPSSTWSSTNGKGGNGGNSSFGGLIAYGGSGGALGSGTGTGGAGAGFGGNGGTGLFIGMGGVACAGGQGGLGGNYGKGGTGAVQGGNSGTAGSAGRVVIVW